LRVMPARMRRVAASNKLFTAAIVAAILIRLCAELGYRWWAYFNDSFSYISTAVTGTLDPVRVSGYSLFLRALLPLHSFAVVTVLQHLMGLAVAGLCYALARRRFGTPAWIAAALTFPVLFDGFEIQLEHLLLSDTLFLFLMALAVVVLLWAPRPGWIRCALAGLLLGASAMVRSTGLPLIAVFAAYLIIIGFPKLRDGRGWLRVIASVAACCAAFALPAAGYEAMYKQQHGDFAMNSSTGVFLYSRVMTFADCSRMTLSPELLSLCTTVPPARRPISQAYIWTPASPLDRFPPTKFDALPNSLAERFAIKAIEAQPLDYARAVFDDTWRAFAWPRSVFPNAATYDEYLFGYHSLDVPDSRTHGYRSSAADYVRGDPLTRVVEPFAKVMRVYQRYVWLPGTVYGLILAAGLVALGWRWRRGGRDALLPWATSLALIVIPAATAEFDYRYVTTAVPFACLALAIALGRGQRVQVPGAQVPGDDEGPAGGVAVDAAAERAEAAGTESVADASGRVSPGTVSPGAVPPGRASGEAGGPASLPRRVPGSGLSGGKANAGHHHGDLTADAT
jgi:hypothetical protein